MSFLGVWLGWESARTEPTIESKKDELERVDILFRNPELAAIFRRNPSIMSGGHSYGGGSDTCDTSKFELEAVTIEDTIIPVVERLDIFGLSEVDSRIGSAEFKKKLKFAREGSG